MQHFRLEKYQAAGTVRRKSKVRAHRKKKEAAWSELANLSGLCAGKRRKELEAQIAEANGRIAALNKELKTLQ